MQELLVLLGDQPPAQRERKRLTFTDTNSWIASKSAWTPYDGVTVTGWPVGAILRGQTVMWQGELITSAAGRPIQFLETLSAAGAQSST